MKCTVKTFTKDEMKRILASLSGVTWLLNDILWYWGFVNSAFFVNCFTILFMGAYFINFKELSKTNRSVVLILNMWVWLSTCSLLKDFLKLKNTLPIDLVAGLISALLVIYCLVIIVTAKKDLREILANLRRL
jgi:hypothetical protein